VALYDLAEIAFVVLLFIGLIQTEAEHKQVTKGRICYETMTQLTSKNQCRTAQD